MTRCRFWHSWGLWKPLYPDWVLKHAERQQIWSRSCRRCQHIQTRDRKPRFARVEEHRSAAAY